MKINELVGDSKCPRKYMSVAPVCPVCGFEHVHIDDDGGPYAVFGADLDMIGQ